MISTLSIKVKITIEPEHQTDKRTKVVLTGDSLLNSISEKVLSKNHQVKAQNFAEEQPKQFYKKRIIWLQRSQIVALSMLVLVI